MFSRLQAAAAPRLPKMTMDWERGAMILSIVLALAVLVVAIILSTRKSLPPPRRLYDENPMWDEDTHVDDGSVPAGRERHYASPLTTPPFMFRTQAKTDLHQAQAPRLYGHVDLDWSSPNADEPWRGAERTRRLDNGKNEALRMPLVSYDFESAGRKRMVQDVTALGPAAAAGLMEQGFARTSSTGENIGYKDLVTVDSLAMPGIIKTQRV